MLKLVSIFWSVSILYMRSCRDHHNVNMQHRYSVAYTRLMYVTAVGFTIGVLKIVDAQSLHDVHPHGFRYSRDAITHIAFSHDSKYLAVAVSVQCVPQ